MISAMKSNTLALITILLVSLSISHAQVPYQINWSTQLDGKIVAHNITPDSKTMYVVTDSSLSSIDMETGEVEKMLQIPIFDSFGGFNSNSKEMIYHKSGVNYKVNIQELTTVVDSSKTLKFFIGDSIAEYEKKMNSATSSYKFFGSQQFITPDFNFTVYFENVDSSYGRNSWTFFTRGVVFYWQDEKRKKLEYKNNSIATNQRQISSIGLFNCYLKDKTLTIDPERYNRFTFNNKLTFPFHIWVNDNGEQIIYTYNAFGDYELTVNDNTSYIIKDSLQVIVDIDEIKRVFTDCNSSRSFLLNNQKTLYCISSEPKEVNLSFDVYKTEYVNEYIAPQFEIDYRYSNTWDMGDSTIYNTHLLNHAYDSIGTYQIIRTSIRDNDTIIQTDSVLVVSRFKAQAGFVNSKDFIKGTEELTLVDLTEYPYGVSKWMLPEGDTLYGRNIKYSNKTNDIVAVVLERSHGDYLSKDSIFIIGKDQDKLLIKQNNILNKEYSYRSNEIPGGYDHIENYKYHLGLCNHYGSTYIYFINGSELSRGSFSNYIHIDEVKHIIMNDSLKIANTCIATSDDYGFCMDVDKYDYLSEYLKIKGDYNNRLITSIQNQYDFPIAFRESYGNIFYKINPTYPNTFIVPSFGQPIYWKVDTSGRSAEFVAYEDESHVLSVPLSINSGVKDAKFIYNNGKNILSYIGDGNNLFLVEVDSNFISHSPTTVPLEYDYLNAEDVNSWFVTDSTLCIQGIVEGKYHYSFIDLNFEGERVQAKKPVNIISEHKLYYLGHSLYVEEVIEGENKDLYIFSPDRGRKVLIDVDMQLKSSDITATGLDGKLHMIRDKDLYIFDSFLDNLKENGIEPQVNNTPYMDIYLSLEKNAETINSNYYYHQGTIYSRNNTKNNITIFDITGREILSRRMTSSGLRANLSRGVYLITDGKSTTKIFVE
ncbi:MAG: hypothetical protein Kapaf2KO_02990 [Candidatus Kapaibacteriales bacterium]